MSVVSQNFEYNVEMEGLASRSYRTILPSESSGYGLGDRAIIQIPHTHNGFLNTSNSWINISATFTGLTSTGTGTVDTAKQIRMSQIGIYSAIQQINIIAGSNGYVQEIRNFQEIMAMLIVNNTDVNSTLPNALTCGTAPNDGLNSRLGTFQTVASTNIATQNFSIPLIGLLGSVKHLPLHFLSENLVVEIIFTSDIRNILYSNVNSSVLSLTGGNCAFSVEYDADIIVVNDNAIREIKQASGFNSGIMSWSDTQIQAVNNSVSITEQNTPSESYKQTLVGGVKPKQLLQVLHGGYGQLNGNTDPWQIYNYMYDSFRLRCGSTQYPPRYIEGIAQIKNHISQCFGQNALTLYNTLATSQTTPISARQVSGAVLQPYLNMGGAGYDFTKFVDTAEGIDTTNKQLITEVNLKALGTATLAMNACTMKRYGVIYSISSDTGQMSVSY